MNRAERRRAGMVRKVLENAPRDARGEMILITGPEVALCAYVSDFLVKVTAEIARRAPETPADRPEVEEMMERDRRFLAAAVTAIKSAGPLEDARLVPPPDLVAPMRTILGAWRGSEERMAVHLTRLGVPPFREVMTILGQSLGLDTPPDWEAMAALDAKLLRIGDAMRGETGLEA